MIGWQELLIILAIVALLFGTSKLSGIGKTIGTNIRDLREGLKEDSEQEDDK